MSGGFDGKAAWHAQHERHALAVAGAAMSSTNSPLRLKSVMRTLRCPDIPLQVASNGPLTRCSPRRSAVIGLIVRVDTSCHSSASQAEHWARCPRRSLTYGCTTLIPFQSPPRLRGRQRGAGPDLAP